MARVMDVTIDELVSDEDLQIQVKKIRAHKNSRSFQMMDYFEKLHPNDQRSLLKQAKLLAQG